MVLKYDEAEKYFYFEGGKAPQTYVGNSMNATLNGYFSDKITKVQSQTIAYGTINGFSGAYGSGGDARIWGFSYSDDEFVGIIANKTQTLTLNGATVSVTAGETYWFKVEPIRWRVSDYGVSSTDYPEGWEEYGSYNTGVVAVSDKLVWANSLTTGKYDAGASWRNDFWAGIINPTQTFYDENFGTSGKGLYKFSDENTDLVVSFAKEPAHYVIANESDARKNLSDIRAKTTDFVAFVMGIDSDEFARYWLGDLGSKYYNVKSVGANGNIKDAWTTNLLGCRLVTQITNASRL